jgi:hypothetical protein
MRQYRLVLHLLATILLSASAFARPLPPANSLVITPKIIDFGKVRVGVQRDTFFTITDTALAKVTLDSTRYQDFISAADSEFVVDSLPGVAHLYKLIQNSVAVYAHFKPSRAGFFSVTIPIHSLEQPTQYVTLQGTGIAPHVISQSHDFGRLRVDSVRQIVLTVQNIGSDTTVLDNITILPHPSLNFTFSDPLPQPTSAQTLWMHRDTIVTIKIRDSIYYDSINKKPDTTFISDTSVTIRDSVRNLRVRYQPRSIGRDSIILRIHMSEDVLLYDTLWGTGIEPLVLVAPDTIDFGTVIAGLTKPPLLDTFITVANRGTYPATVSVSNNQLGTFDIELPPNKLDTGLSIKLRATFVDTVEGSFLDTVFLTNDTRYALYGDSMATYTPSIIMKGTVLTGSLTIPPKAFGDTVRSCETVRNYLPIHNPYPVTVVIDKVLFDSTGVGMKVPETLIEFPLYIPGDSTFQLPLDYSFPPDSLNGAQQITLHYVRSSVEVKDTETTTVTIYRKRPELSLTANLPTYASSANDLALLDLPIYVKGPRQGVHELDAWTMTLAFSNDLFLPAGLDTSGGLVTAHDTTPFVLSYGWDDTNRTFTVTTSGAKLSDTAARFNDLLFKIRMRAFVTPDTEVTVTPVVKFVQYPCAYTLHPFTLKIPYANDCGDIVLRGFMTADTVPMRIAPISPNPAPPASPVTIRVDAAMASKIRVTTFDGAGREIGRAISDVQRGMNNVKISSDLLPHSGLAEVLIEQFSNDTLTARQVLKLAIQ